MYRVSDIDNMSLLSLAQREKKQRRREKKQFFIEKWTSFGVESSSFLN